MISAILNEQIEGFEPWNPKQINPALLTFKEYAALANKQCKWHPEDAYDVDVESLNRYGAKQSEFKLVRTFKRNGLTFQLMIKQEDRRYAVRNPDPDSTDYWVRDEKGMVIYYTKEEQDRLGLQPHEWTVAIFHKGKKVAVSQDEWGCMLIMVAREFRSFGLGTIVGKMARTLEPHKDSGGFTQAGYNNFARVHREFVRDALTNGLYRSMIKTGQITKERVKEIVASTDLKKRQSNNGPNLDSSNPVNWLLYGDHYGTFILYDRGLVDLVSEGERFEHFADNMVKGMVYAMLDDRVGIARIKQFGAQTEKLKAFMLSLAYTYAKSHDTVLYAEPDEYNLQGFEYGEESVVAGYSSREVLKGPLVDYRGMVEDEKRFRARFDKYDEFLHALMDYAHRIF